MPVPSSGQLRLRADINQEINGNDTDNNVSLGTLSNDAGFSEPDTMSEFYGYSSVTTPTVTYNSYSSNYTTATLNYTVDWGGASGSYNLKCEIYGSSALGTPFYQTDTIVSSSNPPGSQTYSFTITPPSQYVDQDTGYRIKVKAQNSEGTTTEPSSGYRNISLSTPTYYTLSNFQNYYGSYGGWQKYGPNWASPTSVTELENHPQLGFHTTHKTNINGSSFTGEVFAPGLSYSGSNAMAENLASWVIHKNAWRGYSGGTNFEKRILFDIHLSNVSFSGGSNNAFGLEHSGNTSVPFEWLYYTISNYSATSSPTNVYASSSYCNYNLSGSQGNWSGWSQYYCCNQSASNQSVNLKWQYDFT